MVYAKRVKSPLKGGVDVELGPKTVLCGPNGAGKTAILQALKLATCGYVDDQEGKDNIRGTAALARLFPQGAQLTSAVEMSDGANFSWDAKTRGKGFTKPKTSVKERPYKVAFPFQGVKALLSGDDKKIRSWLEARAGSSLTVTDLLGMLPPAQQADAKPILARFDQRSPVELAVALKGEARSLRAQATRKERTVEQLVAGIPLPLSDVAAQELAARKGALWREANKPGIMSPEAHQALRATVEALAETLTQVETQIQAMPEAQEDEAETLRIASKGHALAKEHLEHLGTDVCYVCLRKDADVQGAYDRWAGVVGDLGSASARRRLQTQHDQGMVEVQALARRYKEATVVDSTAVLEEHGTIQAALATHMANQRVWRQAEGLRKEVAGSRATADTCAALGRTWEKEGDLLLRRRKKAYEDTVTAWLPEGEIFVLDLEASRVGLAHVLAPNAVHTSLSGAELSRVLLAVLSAEGGADGSTPSILEPEDRGWDPDTLSRVMSALTDSPDQVILMSTVLPSQSPDGWSVIRVGA
jgi:hypothetical protein